MSDDVVERLIDLKTAAMPPEWRDILTKAADEIRALRFELYRTRVMLGQMANSQREGSTPEQP